MKKLDSFYHLIKQKIQWSNGKKFLPEGTKGIYLPSGIYIGIQPRLRETMKSLALGRKLCHTELEDLAKASREDIDRRYDKFILNLFLFLLGTLPGKFWSPEKKPLESGREALEGGRKALEDGTKEIRKIFESLEKITWYRTWKE